MCIIIIEMYYSTIWIEFHIWEINVLHSYVESNYLWLDGRVQPGAATIKRGPLFFMYNFVYIAPQPERGKHKIYFSQRDRKDVTPQTTQWAIRGRIVSDNDYWLTCEETISNGSIIQSRKYDDQTMGIDMCQLNPDRLTDIMTLTN